MRFLCVSCVSRLPPVSLNRVEAIALLGFRAHSGLNFDQRLGFCLRSHITAQSVRGIFIAHQMNSVFLWSICFSHSASALWAGSWDTQTHPLGRAAGGPFKLDTYPELHMRRCCSYAAMLQQLSQLHPVGCSDEPPARAPWPCFWSECAR